MMKKKKKNGPVKAAKTRIGMVMGRGRSGSQERSGDAQSFSPGELADKHANEMI